MWENVLLRTFSHIFDFEMSDPINVIQNSIDLL